MSELKCPFCGEPRLRFSCGVNRFACGTVGPYLNDGEGEYETGHTCDIHTYSRLFKEMEQRLAAAEEAKLDAQDDARAQFGRYMDCDKAYRALQDRLAAAEAARGIAEQQLTVICDGVNRRCNADNRQLPLVSLDRMLAAHKRDLTECRRLLREAVKGTRIVPAGDGKAMHYLAVTEQWYDEAEKLTK